MFETIAIIAIIIWGLALVSAQTMGGFIHLLLVIAIVAIVPRCITGPLRAARRDTLERP